MAWGKTFGRLNVNTRPFYEDGFVRNEKISWAALFCVNSEN